MSRRPLVTICINFAAAIFAIALSAQNFVDIKPSPQRNEWQDLEFGVIIHVGTNTFLDREWGRRHRSPQVFAPTDFNPEQWMQAVKSAGARYVVLVRITPCSKQTFETL